MLRAAILLTALLLTPFRPLSAQGWEWQNPLPRGNTINGIVMLDELRGIAICNDGIMLWSADGGMSWASYRIATVNLHDIKRMSDGSLLIAADRRRILRSTDDGFSWTLVYQGMTDFRGYRSSIAIVDERTVTAFLNGGDLVTSTDFGQSWRQINTLSLFNENPRSISIQSPTVWWIVTSRNTWVTNDAGETWLNANEAYPPRGLQRFVFLDSLSGYQCRDGQLLSTQDGGVSWEEMNIFGFGAVLDVAAGPALGDNVYCLSYGRYLINKSPDGGASWNISLTESAFANAYVSAMTFVNADLGFLVGDGGRILRTGDGGQSWSIVHGQGYIGTIAELYFFDDRNGIALTYSPTVLLTSNGGERWDEAIPVSGHTLRRLSVSPSGIAWAVAYSPENHYYIYRSDDMGRNWQRVGERLPIMYSPFNQLLPQSLLAATDTDLLLSVSYARLYRSTDAGLSWDSTFVPAGGSAPFLSGQDMAFFPPSTIYYSLYTSLAVSTDNGSTWDNRRDPSAGGSMWRTRFLTEDVGYSIISGRLSSTTDGGRRWNRLTNINPELYYFFDAKNGLLLSSDSENDNWAWLYETTDGGQSWDRSSLGGQVSWTDWFFRDRSLGWAIAYGGLIQRTTSGGLVQVRPLPEHLEATQLDAVWPNPFSFGKHSALNITFDLDAEQFISLSLFDLLGREVARIAEGIHTRGRHAVHHQLSSHGSLSSGMYKLRLLTAYGQHSASVLIHGNGR